MAEPVSNGELAQKVGGWLAAVLSGAWAVRKHRQARAIDVQERIEALENYRRSAETSLRESERFRSEIHRLQEEILGRMNAVEIRQDRVEREQDDAGRVLRRIEQKLEELLAAARRRVLPDPTTEQRRPDAEPSR